jgi:hypothetical protein
MNRIRNKNKKVMIRIKIKVGLMLKVGTERGRKSRLRIGTRIRDN